MPRRTLYALVLAILFGAFAAPAATLTVGASRDNTLYEDPSGSISNGIGEHLYAGRTGIAADDRLRRGLLAFDLSTIPANATVSAAQLTINLTRSSPTGPATITLHRMTQVWGEGSSVAFDPGGSGAAAALGDATWTTPFFGSLTPIGWATPGGDFVSTASASQSVNALQAYTFGSTAQMVADVQAWIQNPAANAGWMLRGDESVAGTAKRFASREHGNTLIRPSLTVTYEVPEPTTIPWLATLILLARRRRPHV